MFIILTACIYCMYIWIRYVYIVLHCVYVFILYTDIVAYLYILIYVCIHIQEVSVGGSAGGVAMPQSSGRQENRTFIEIYGILLV